MAGTMIATPATDALSYRGRSYGPAAFPDRTDAAAASPHHRIVATVTRVQRRPLLVAIARQLDKAAAGSDNGAGQFAVARLLLERAFRVVETER